MTNREQLVAFISLIVAILILGLAPVVTAGIMGKTLPDSLIAVSDKTVTGLVGVLGALASMIFRTNRTDQAATENTGEALKTIRAVASMTPADAPALAEAAADQVAGAAQSEADKFKGDDHA